MQKQIISSGQGDSEGRIADLIQWLQEAQKQGATHYNLYWSGDPMWAFKWVETYRILSDEEVKQLEIAKLEDQLNKLKS